MDAVKALSCIPPICLVHVNLVGRFDFTSDATDIDFDAIVAPIFDPKYWSKALVEDSDEVLELFWKGAFKRHCISTCLFLPFRGFEQK